MSQTPSKPLPCGCSVEHGWVKGADPVISYCPMHAAAKEMLAVLTDAFVALPMAKHNKELLTRMSGVMDKAIGRKPRSTPPGRTDESSTKPQKSPEAK